MHYFRFIPLILLAVILSACADIDGTVDAADDEALNEVLVIENVTVVPMDEERAIPGQTVIVEGDRIASISDAEDADIPDEGIRVDGEGQYLMPGIAELHGHLPGPDNEELRESSLYLFVANGVTYVRGMQGASDHPELRDAIEAGERFGPTLRVASPGFGGADLTEEEARARVQEYAEQGFDLLKIFEGLTPEVYDAIVDEANAQNIPFAGHVSDDVGLLRSLEAGHKTIDHLDNYVEALRTEEAPDDFPAIFGAGVVAPYADRERISEIVEATRESGAGVVPTMLLWEAFFDDRPVEEYRDLYPELQYIPEDMLDGWEEGLRGIRENFEPEEGEMVRELRREILWELHEAGAPVLLGSDAPQIFNVPGFSTHREMQFKQDEVGISPYDVLVTGTRAVAEFYDEQDEFGTVEEGLRADLILVEGNPLDDVANAADVAGVVVRGQWLSANEIETRLDELAVR